MDEMVAHRALPGAIRPAQAARPAAGRRRGARRLRGGALGPRRVRRPLGPALLADGGAEEQDRRHGAARRRHRFARRRDDASKTDGARRDRLPEPRAREIAEQRQLLRSRWPASRRCRAGLRDAMRLRVLDERSTDEVCARTRHHRGQPLRAHAPRAESSCCPERVSAGPARRPVGRGLEAAPARPASSPARALRTRRSAVWACGVTGPRKSAAPSLAISRVGKFSISGSPSASDSSSTSIQAKSASPWKRAASPSKTGRYFGHRRRTRRRTGRRRARAPERRPSALDVEHVVNLAADHRRPAPWVATVSRSPQAMIFARHVLHGLPLDKAIDAPRWLLGRTWGSTHTNLSWSCASTDT